MKTKKPEQKKPSELRNRAEEKLKSQITPPKIMSDNETRQLIHELRVHQIELEMQNDELRKAQAELEESRTGYSDLYDFAPAGYFTFDKNGLMLEANLTAAKELGIERSLLIGKPFRAYIVTGDREIFDSHLRKVFKSDDRQTCEIRLKRKNGIEIFAQLESIAAEKLSGNNMCRTAVIDITERKRAGDTIKRLSRQNELILNSAGEGILGLDLRGNHTFVNPSAARMLGYEIEELIGRNSHATWHYSRADGSPYPREECSIYAAYRDGAVRVKDDEVFWRKDGTSFPVRYTSTPILEDGNIIGAVVTFRDITEQKRVVEAMKESEEKFRKLASSAQDAIIMMDNEGNFFYCNESFERIFGFSGIEILGKEIHAIIAPERYYKDYKKGFALFRKTGKGPVIGKTLELIAVKKDGTEFPIELSVSALQFKGNWISIGILRDITERKRAEEELKKSEERHRILFMSSRDPIMTLEPPLWMFTSGNPATIALFGSEDEVDFVSHAPWQLSPERQPNGWLSNEKAKEMIETAMREGSHFFEWTHKRINGEEFPATVLLTKVVLGDKTFLQATVHDITKQKQAVEALKRSHNELEMRVTERTREFEDANLELQALNKELNLRRQEAEHAKLQAMEASRAKSDFLANMSHELRTPLNAIIGFSDMMFQGMTGKLTERQLEYLVDIRESGELLLFLINDILDLSKVEAGKMKLDLSEFDLKELIERSLVMFKEKALKHNMKVKHEVDERTGSITADERRLKQVMFNLLSNAFKFTPDGGSVHVHARKVRSQELGVGSFGEKESLEFGVRSSERQRIYFELNTPNSELDRDFIEISVADTGIGIRHDDIDKLFQPFRQLEYTLTKKYEGTGLGLTLCKRIVELHNGRIWVESEVDKGSKFTFVIPI